MVIGRGELRKMDIRHFYMEKGQGKPLILLHGNGEDSSYFEKQIEEFAQYYHATMLQLRQVRR